MHHKRGRAKKQRAGGARHGMCKPQKVVGNSRGKMDRLGARRASEARRMPEVLGIHWPDVDEDLSVAGILRGTPAPTKSR